MRRIKKQSFVISLTIVAVLAGTMLVIALRPPEGIDVTSPDGRVRAEGNVLSGETAVVIEALAHKEGLPDLMREPLYRIELTRSLSPLPFTLRFRSLESATLYAFDQRLGAWQPVPSVWQADTQEVVAQVRLFESQLWGVGSALSQEIPSFAPVVVDELRAAPPPDAVGYRAFAAVSSGADRDFVMIDSVLDTGGCNGAFKSGKTQTLSSKDRTIGSGDVRIGMLWEIGAGCAKGETIRSGR